MGNSVIDRPQRRLAYHGGCYALVPIKRRVVCKGRLAAALAADERLRLVRFMLGQVLAALADADCVDHVAVVSPERDTLPGDVAVMADAGQGLNAALSHAQQGLLELGAREILVVPADLPRISGEDIDALVRAGRTGGFALAPDAGDVGTNALFWSSNRAAGGPLHFHFGPDSKQYHQAEARRLGLNACLVRLPGFAFDVDTPQDLAQLGGALSGAPYSSRRQADHV